jgi:hypothetical protein
MGREHRIALELHSSTSADHRAEPRHRSQIRRLAVIRSDSQGFRIVSNPSERIAATRPQLDDDLAGRQRRFGRPAVSDPPRQVRAPALAN